LFVLVLLQISSSRCSFAAVVNSAACQLFVQRLIVRVTA